MPPALTALAEEFERQVAAGLKKKHSSGYGGEGHKFDAEEELEVKRARDMWRRDLESSAGIDDFVDEEEERRREREIELAQVDDDDGTRAVAA